MAYLLFWWWDVSEETEFLFYFYFLFQDHQCTFLADSQLCIHFWRGLNYVSWLFMGCIINSRLHTPLFPLISHRCQKEACTEIKGRIWALCSKIKLSVVIFYITFRIAHWKIFSLLELLLPLLLSLFSSFLLSFLWLFFLLLFLSATTSSHSQCNAAKWWVL